MEKKNNKVIIILMGVIIIILAVLCVLFAIGTITFNNKVTNNSDRNTFTKEDNNPNENQIYSADKYISLEDVELSSKVSIKKVKINYLNNNATKDFYDQQEALLETAKSYASETNEEMFDAKYSLDYSINWRGICIWYVYLA